VSVKFWLDREQHPSHIFAHTRESAAERAQLLDTLRELGESTRPQKQAPRQRKQRPRKSA